MAEKPTKCAGCGRPFAARFATCPFCGVAAATKSAEASAAPVAPSKCAKCGRLFGAHLARCPFCRGEGAGPHVMAEDERAAVIRRALETGREEEQPPNRWIGVAVVVLVVLLLACVPLAVWSAIRWPTLENTLSWTARYAGVGGGIVAIVVRHLLSREQTWSPDRTALQWIAQHALVFLFGAVPIGSAVYAVTAITNGTDLGPPQKLGCVVNEVKFSRRGRLRTVFFRCELGEGRVLDGESSLSHTGRLVTGDRFELWAREGRLRAWIETED